jgi:hypothetical protein
MAVADDIPRGWGIASLAALVAIAIVPPWLCIVQGGASWHLVAAGALIWSASVCAKRLIVMAAARVRAAFVPLSPMAVAALQGVISAATELGAAAAYLATLPVASLVELVAFGAGAGCAEAGYVLLLGIFGPQVDEAELRAWARGAAVSWCVRYAVPIERLFALIGHIGARGLVYLALLHGSPLGALWAILAVLLFAIVDTVAVYGHLKKWQWHDPALCRPAHSFFAILGVGEFLLFLVGFQLSG